MRRLGQRRVVLVLALGVLATAASASAANAAPRTELILFSARGGSYRANGREATIDLRRPRPARQLSVEPLGRSGSRLGLRQIDAAVRRGSLLTVELFAGRPREDSLTLRVRCVDISRDGLRVGGTVVAPGSLRVRQSFDITDGRLPAALPATSVTVDTNPGGPAPRIGGRARRGLVVGSERADRRATASSSWSNSETWPGMNGLVMNNLVQSAQISCMLSTGASEPLSVTVVPEAPGLYTPDEGEVIPVASPGTQIGANFEGRFSFSTGLAYVAMALQLDPPPPGAGEAKVGTYCWGSVTESPGVSDELVPGLEKAEEEEWPHVEPAE